MTYSELLYQLKQWEKHNPELLENPAIFSDAEGYEIEIDNIDHLDNDGEQNIEINTPTFLTLTP